MPENALYISTMHVFHYRCTIVSGAAFFVPSHCGNEK